ncbi:plasmid replication protein RepC [Microvirga mediterraneensis]|uniref:Helix-turn-helix domain-containing protein n=1 Tax=Microvirga mediterraneensis TaxID=2754695 RepID=A0A838BV58_9HYPH|nr:plasmid replication protein RepC [Microvirga mediterraneensis]MBA1158929.1 helix-turn-helix domain-containing protein [Microvirga mediterraneensis]
MQLASSGGRRLRHAALAARKLALEAERTVTRKELSAAARDAGKALDLRPAQRAVLSELVACWGEQEWERLLVWPSNDYLISRTGLTERAIRRILRQLIDLQLLAPKDSPNGKRYAVKDQSGQVVDAFGFDLTPIYARRGDWAALLIEQKQLREVQKRAFDEVTICRRAAEEALSALAEHFPAVDRTGFEDELKLLQARTPARSRTTLPADLLEAWQLLRTRVEDAFYETGKAGLGVRHIDNNNGSPSEPCNKSFPKKAEAVRSTEQTSEHLSPELILEACPTVSDYGQPVRDLADIVSAGRYLRAALGAHESAWAEAVEDIGTVRSAIAVIYVLQLYEDDMARNGGESRIKNPGGYFRALTRMVKSGKIDLAVEILAMRRRRMA